MGKCNIVGDLFGYSTQADAEACVREKERETGKSYFVARAMIAFPRPRTTYAVEDCKTSTYKQNDRAKQCAVSLERIRKGKKK